MTLWKGTKQMKANSCCNVSNLAAQDRFLSLKAKGLYLLIQSCMEDPEFDVDRFKPALQAKCKEGSDAFESAWKELKTAGYLKQLRIPFNDGKSKGFCYEYELLEIADPAAASLKTLSKDGKSVSPKRSDIRIRE